MWNKLYNIEFLRKYKICCVHLIVEDDLFLFQTLFVRLHVVLSRILHIFIM